MDYKKLWIDTVQFILKVANDEEKRQEYINIKIKECDEKIKEISNYDSETHAILSADIKSFYDYYNKIKEDDKLYEQFLDSPFISHINLDNKIYYISKVKSQIENNLILWTCPIAKMRTFGIGSASLINGNRYILLNRCKYNIEKSKLCDIEYEDEKGAFKFNGSQYTICNNYEPIIVSDKKREFINNDAEGTKTDSLTREKYVLGEIISTMTQEQDNALRLPENGITIIEGVAGSGKTNIGFHRLVYLINEFPKKFSQKNIAVFCYNLALKKYLENLAKELFLNDIKIFSIDE